MKNVLRSSCELWPKWLCNTYIFYINLALFTISTFVIIKVKDVLQSTYGYCLYWKMKVHL